MAHITRKEWYRRVNAAWPSGPLPDLEPQEALEAARRLYRYVRGRKRTIPPARLTSGNRGTSIRGGAIHVNPTQGWERLVHSLSHGLLSAPHGGEHARLERRMILEVVRRGWLEGKLRQELEARRELAARRAKPAPTPQDLRARKIATCEAQIADIDHDLRRLARRRSKLLRSLRGLERARKAESGTDCPSGSPPDPAPDGR